MNRPQSGGLNNFSKFSQPPQTPPMNGLSPSPMARQFSGPQGGGPASPSVNSSNSFNNTPSRYESNGTTQTAGNNDDSDSESAAGLPPSSSIDEDELNNNNDPSNGWIEFVDLKSHTKLYYNSVTQQAQFERPTELGDDNDNDESDDDDDGVENALPTLGIEGNDMSKFSRRRRDSSILSEAWQQENLNRKVDNVSTKRPGHSRNSIAEEENLLENNGPDNLNEGPGLARGRSHTVSTKAMNVEKMVKSLSLIEKQVQLILSASQQLAPQVCDDLRAIRSRVENVQQALEKGAVALDNRTDVDALTESDKLPWSLHNVHVDYYRAAAVRVCHSEFEFKEWHAPQYFSASPLPPGVKSVTAVVKLPMGDGPDGGDAEHASTRISVSETTTALNAIGQALAKCRTLGTVDPQDFVLKAIGLHDYMFGDKLLFDYEYVRSCMRDTEQLKLALVRKPAPLPALPNENSLRDIYRSKINPEIRLLEPDDYKHVSSGSSARGVDSWSEMRVLHMSDVQVPFRFQILGMDNLNESSLPRLPSVSHFYIHAFLFHGGAFLPDAVCDTDLLPVTGAPRWSSSFSFKDVSVSNLPRGARIGFLIIGKAATSTAAAEAMLGWVALQLVDEFGNLTTGRQTLRLWAMDAHKKGKHGKVRDPEPDFIFRATTRENLSDANAPLLHIQFDEFALPVVAPIEEKFREPNVRIVGPEVPLKSLTRAQTQLLETLLQQDALHVLSQDEKILLWTVRHSLVRHPHMLAKFLQCVSWGNPDQKFEAHRLLARWALPVAPASALELLDAKYPDYTVREYAVNILRRVPDDELKLYLLQFVQCLKFEPYHDSPLARFLIERSLRSPLCIGHFLFWHLKAELHDPYFCERFYLIIEELLSFSPRLAQELRKQNGGVLKLQRVAEMIVRLKREHGLSDAEATPEYVKELTKLNTDFFSVQGKFQIPLNPKLEATTLIVEKCRYMSSKMVPLWLVFKNADTEAGSAPIYIIFKSGDDLRQDILTLQLLTVMDKLWLANGLDLKMKPYKCIATGINEAGDGVGMIEVVLNSDTTSGIQLKYGGGAVGALKDDPIDLFLIDMNKGKQLYERAVDNFVCSCAGYCVATFVLGIGDRHNGNIMVTRDGHLFHIDFGHFLGNFKKKFGVNRERAAFVFTPEMAYVMGGKKYESHALFKKFMHLATKSFNSLRLNATWLENLFVLMSAAGMPELMKEKDIHYMRDKLCLNMPEKKADKKFEEEVQKSLQTTYRRIDNFIHIMKHG